MAKRRLLQWMRDRLISHAEKVVVPAVEKRALDQAYRHARVRVAALITKKFPPADMKVLAKWKAATPCTKPHLQPPAGPMVEFVFEVDDAPARPDAYDYRNQVFLADDVTAAAVQKWEAARVAYKAEREKRLNAYRAMVQGSGFVEDLIEVWPEAANILPKGSPPILLGPEQIALVKADQRERKAA